MNMKNRKTDRLFGEDGRALIVAVDHTAYKDTPVVGLEDFRGMVRTMAGSGLVDSFIAPLGSLLRLSDEFGRIPVVASVETEPPFGELAAERAVELGADGVKCYLYPFSGDDSVRAAYRMAANSARLALPFIAEPFPGGMANVAMHTPEHIIAAARVAFETGADVIKSLYTGDPESMAQLVAYCEPVPVLVLGGSKSDSLLGFLRTIHDAISIAGCAGAAVGTNIFANEDPVGVIEALDALIHHDADPESAIKLVKTS